MGRRPRVDQAPEEKRQIVQEGIKSGNVSETCRRHGISPSLFPHVRRAPRPDNLPGAAQVSRSKVPTLCWRKGSGTRHRLPNRCEEGSRSCPVIQTLDYA
jgi:transposase-like protein